MIIQISNSQKNLSLSYPAIRKVVHAVVALERQLCDEVSINFVSTKKISALHKEFFDDPTTTDCISFPLDDIGVLGGYRLLGEIFVCPQTAVDYAEKRQKDAYQELTLYIVHGLLHLMGYDDIDIRDRAKMRAAERKHMKNLQAQDLILRSAHCSQEVC